ncbi:MAG: prepilin-type N-terminal cleavage/methylation domain-containing protein [Candidatus Pacebacteria bacterium]|nr:prepilin-type N-terminal cleavage/methylation domain-containing protein [Candidatus Paceibacterota bacterium]
MFNLFKKYSEKGFTFIELLAAMIALSIGILSVIAISSKSYSAISFQKNKLIATYLAKEGIEHVRAMRNENWLYKDESDCNRDFVVTKCCDQDKNPTCDIDEDGQVKEDGGDCDWRCGDESNPASSYQPNCILGAPRHVEGSIYYVYTKDLMRYGNSWLCVVASTTSETAPTSCKDYGYSHGSNIKRLLVVDRTKDLNQDGNPNNDLLVQSIVCWQQGGRWQEVVIEDHLFNWKK